MNWYTTAMALPEATGYPQSGSRSDLNTINQVDEGLNPDVADALTKEFGPLKYLGHGSYGIAYDQKNPERVLKVTDDDSEAIAANRLMQNPIPCAVRIYSVKKLNDMGWWALETQRVNPIPVNTKRYIAYIASLFNSNFDNNVGENTTFEYALEGTKSDSECRIRFGISIDKAREIFNRYRTMFMCLKSNGFNATDAYSSNIGINKNGSFILLDVGHSV